MIRYLTFEDLHNAAYGIVYPSTGNTYSTGDTALPRETYETITSAYPALIAHPNAPTFRRLLQYLLFSPFKDDQGHTIAPYPTLQKIAGIPRSNHRFHAGRLLEEFSDCVWELGVQEPQYWSGKARTVEPRIPAVILNALDAAVPDPTQQRVWLGAGRDVTKSGIRAAGKVQRMEMRAFADGISPDNPAHELLTFLNSLKTNCLTARLAANWNELIATWGAMPRGTLHECERWRQAQRVLMQIQDNSPTIYSTSEKTPRAFTLGLSVNSLPRELRKIALRGCVELDARACQLAIVANLWRLPCLTDFLDSRRSVWNELTGHLGLDADEYKPSVKRLIYGIVFGAREISLRAWMRDGDEGINPLTLDQATAFLNHPLVTELIAGRNARLRQIRQERHVVDAFGNRREYNPERDVRFRSLLAQEVQSYEVSLMLSLLERVKDNRDDVHILSWLHDGISLWFSDKTKAAGMIRSLQRDFACAAQARGFLTELEVGGTPPFDL